MKEVSIAVVGATGAVGSEFLKIMQERKFPAGEIKLLASSRSAGVKLEVNGRKLTVQETTAESFAGVQIAFISVSSEVSRRLVPEARKAGAVVIDDSSAFRMSPDVKLVVPEVNASDLDSHTGVISIPNCSTTPLVMALAPLGRLAKVRRVVADTYQSVAGTGAAAMTELRDQARSVLDEKKAERKVYPHQIAFNVFPQVERFLDNGYTTEEWKMLEESRKILHWPDLLVSATCVRVPVYISHCVSAHVEFDRPVSPQEARQALAAMPGVKVLDDPSQNQYPTPWNVAGTDDVFVGRIRKDASHPNGLAMWIALDNLRKGAALNAIQIAEELLKRNLLPERKVLQQAD